jgi:hypothetical protein
VASSKAVKDAKSSAVSIVVGGEATYNTLKKLYNYVVGNYVSKSSINSSHTSTSTSTVASSKAVYDAKNSVLSTIRGGVSSSYDTLKELLDYVTGNYVSNSRVSDNHTSSSKTDVASSKAVKDAKSSVISTLLGGESTYNTLKKMYNYIAGNYIAKSKISNSYTSTSTTTIASSKAIRDGVNSAKRSIGFDVISSWSRTYSTGNDKYEIEAYAVKYRNGMVKLSFMCDSEPGKASYLDVNRVEVPVQSRPVVDVFFVGAGSVSGNDISQGKLKLGTNGKIEDGFPTHAVVMYQAIMTPSELSDYYVM